MAIYDGPNGEQFVMPDAPPDVGVPISTESPGQGYVAPNSAQPEFYGLAPEVLQGIAPWATQDPAITHGTGPLGLGSQPSALGPENPYQRDEKLGSVDTGYGTTPAPRPDVGPDGQLTVAQLANDLPMIQPPARGGVKPAAAAPQQDMFDQAAELAMGGLQSERQAQKDLFDIAQQRDAAVQQAQAKAAVNIPALEAEAQRKRDEYMAGLKAEHENVSAQVKRWSDMKVDRGRLWNNSSTGRQILGALGVAMSALGDILNKRTGPNLALNMIMSAIDKDVNDQVRERDNEKDKIGVLRTSYDDYKKQGATEVEAKQMKVAEEIEKVRRAGAMAAAKYNTPEATARWQIMDSQLVAKQADLLNKTAEGRFNRKQAGEELRLKKIAEGRQQAAENRAEREFANRRYEYSHNIELAKAAKDAEIAAAKADKKGGIGGFVSMGADGKPIYESARLRDGSVWKPDPALVPFFIKSRSATQQSINWLSIAKRLREDEGGALPTEPDLQKKYNQAIKMAVTEFANAKGQSISDDASFNQVRDALFGGDPSDVLGGSGYAERIQKSIDAVEENFNSLTRGAQYDGDAFRFAHPEIKPKETPREALLKETIKSGASSGVGYQGFISAYSKALSGDAQAIADLETMSREGNAFTRQEAAKALYKIKTGAEYSSNPAVLVNNAISESQARAVRNANEAADKARAAAAAKRKAAESDAYDRAIGWKR